MSEFKPYHLTDNLKHILDHTSEEASLEIRKMIDGWEEAYINMRKDHNEESCAYNLAQEMDKEIKAHIKRNRDQIDDLGGIKCKKGCYYCCEQHVGISLDEGILLYEAIKDKLMFFDWDKVKRQAEYDANKWHEQPREDWACPLLNEDKQCSLYEFRPYVCRKYLVFTDPKKCNTEVESDEADIGRFCTPPAEIMTTGAWNAVNDVDSLPRQLLKAKELRTKRKEENNDNEEN